MKTLRFSFNNVTVSRSSRTNTLQMNDVLKGECEALEAIYGDSFQVLPVGASRNEARVKLTIESTPSDDVDGTSVAAPSVACELTLV
jgi:hypothetical protein